MFKIKQCFKFQLNFHSQLLSYSVFSTLADGLLSPPLLTPLHLSTTHTIPHYHFSPLPLTPPHTPPHTTLHTTPQHSPSTHHTPFPLTTSLTPPLSTPPPVCLTTPHCPLTSLPLTPSLNTPPHSFSPPLFKGTLSDHRVRKKSSFYEYKPLQDLPFTQNIISDNFMQKIFLGHNRPKVGI